jgi:hypothetical protein
MLDNNMRHIGMRELTNTALIWTPYQGSIDSDSWVAQSHWYNRSKAPFEG